METNQKRAADGSVTQQQFAALEAKIIGLSQSVRDLQQTLSNMQRDIVTHNDVVLMEEMMRLLVANHLLDDIDKEIEATGKEMRIPTIPLGYELAFKGYNEIYFQPSSIEIWNLDSGLSNRPYISVQVWERKGGTYGRLVFYPDGEAVRSIYYTQEFQIQSWEQGEYHVDQNFLHWYDGKTSEKEPVHEILMKVLKWMLAHGKRIGKTG